VHTGGGKLLKIGLLRMRELVRLSAAFLVLSISLFPLVPHALAQDESFQGPYISQVVSYTFGNLPDEAGALVEDRLDLIG
jgi:hypothetical protein